MRKTIFIAIAAVVALVSCKGNGNTEASQVDTDSLRQVSSGAIAYVQMDSLLSGYDMAVELNAAFQAKYEKAERDMTTRGNSLQKEMMDYQDKVQKGLLLRSQMAEQEEALTKKQQNLVSYRDRLLGELDEEQRVMNNKIFYAITDYLKEYNADYRYSMIITTSAQGPVLAADPALDITKEVLAELNRRYAKEKK